MANFLDKTGLESILQAISSKFARKSEVVTKAECPAIWTGTQAEYDAISNLDANTLYCITDA